ncbi:hypothetical protein FRX31_019776 [Thalictrum thalictroides]|uniref:S-adenosyl-l-methionine-dependent methyltransferases superfamily protein n=1 Tax=Thalictrum thalictroides TaxID=46969 RepID=A0A7J6W117_THATH|nr:hypothetical protein FRX31_019776 [Thalictrum thalictroides]
MPTSLKLWSNLSSSWACTLALVDSPEKCADRPALVVHWPQSIERFELLGLKSSGEIVPETLSMHARASMEERIGEHFGSEILDELFDLFTKKAAELGICNSENRFDAELFVLLKRK